MHGFTTSRRNFLRGAGAWFGATALGLRAGVENFRTVAIFHTTDLHGHIVPTRSYEGVDDLGGFARCATRIRQWRKEFPHSLLVDLGDVYQGTPECHAPLPAGAGVSLGARGVVTKNHRNRTAGRGCHGLLGVLFI